MDVQVVLEASAIATIMGAGISYFTFRKSSKLTYITQERKAWRTEIRKIAEELEMCSYIDRKHVLVKLKTRINAYGYTDSKNDGNIGEDSHIWEKIEQIENCDEKDYERLRNQLIIFLSLLLKADWERAKKEVKGEVMDALTFICLVIFGVNLAVYFWESATATSNQVIVALKKLGSGMEIAILMLIICVIINWLLKKSNIKNSFGKFGILALFWTAVIMLGAMVCLQKEAVSLSMAGGAIIVLGICQLIMEFNKYSDYRIYVARVHAIDKKNEENNPKKPG